jgi:hypothetical protein
MYLVFSAFASTLNYECLKYQVIPRTKHYTIKVYTGIEFKLRSFLRPPVYKAENTAVGFCCAGHATPSMSEKLTLTSPSSSGRSVGIVRSRTKATEWVSRYNNARF